jgi:hypothetical protein
MEGRKCGQVWEIYKKEQMLLGYSEVNGKMSGQVCKVSQHRDEVSIAGLEHKVSGKIVSGEPRKKRRILYACQGCFILKIVGIVDTLCCSWIPMVQ